MAITQLHPGVIVGRRYGSFAGKIPTPVIYAASYVQYIRRLQTYTQYVGRDVSYIQYIRRLQEYDNVL